jgi:hypothetical protein
MWDILFIGREPIPKYTILSINLIYGSLQPSITSYSMILSITYETKSGSKPEMVIPNLSGWNQGLITLCQNP